MATPSEAWSRSVSGPMSMVRFDASLQQGSAWCSVVFQDVKIPINVQSDLYVPGETGILRQAMVDGLRELGQCRRPLAHAHVIATRRIVWFVCDCWPVVAEEKFARRTFAHGRSKQRRVVCESSDMVEGVWTQPVKC